MSEEELEEKYNLVLNDLDIAADCPWGDEFKQPIKRMLLDRYSIEDVVGAVLEYEEMGDSDLSDYLNEVSELEEDCTQASNVDGGKVDIFTNKEEEEIYNQLVELDDYNN